MYCQTQISRSYHGTSCCCDNEFYQNMQLGTICVCRCLPALYSFRVLSILVVCCKWASTFVVWWAVCLAGQKWAPAALLVGWTSDERQGRCTTRATATSVHAHVQRSRAVGLAPCMVALTLAGFSHAHGRTWPAWPSCPRGGSGSEDTHLFG
jgi:hypothetical protein